MSGTYVRQYRADLGVDRPEVAKVPGSIREATASMSSTIYDVVISVIKEDRMTNFADYFSPEAVWHEGSGAVTVTGGGSAWNTGSLVTGFFGKGTLDPDIMPAVLPRHTAADKTAGQVMPILKSYGKEVRGKK